MQSTIWTIALISVGIVTPNIQNMGYFLEEKDCKQALVELKIQDLGLKISIAIACFILFLLYAQPSNFTVYFY